MKFIRIWRVDVPPTRGCILMDEQQNSKLIGQCAIKSILYGYCRPRCSLALLWYGIVLLVSAEYGDQDAFQATSCGTDEHIHLSADHTGEKQQAIRRMEWSRDAFMKAIVDSEPVVFTDPPSATWKCSLWTPAALAKRMPWAEVQTKWKQCILLPHRHSA